MLGAGPVPDAGDAQDENLGGRAGQGVIVSKTSRMRGRAACAVGGAARTQARNYYRSHHVEFARAAGTLGLAPAFREDGSASPGAFPRADLEIGRPEGQPVGPRGIERSCSP